MSSLSALLCDRWENIVSPLWKPHNPGRALEKTATPNWPRQVSWQVDKPLIPIRDRRRTKKWP